MTLKLSAAVAASGHVHARRRMVAKLVADGAMRDARVIAAFQSVPRHLFVRDHLLHDAYADNALPIGCEQTISQPWVVARMTEGLAVGEDDSVLEIGTGSGYQTAILALLAGRVYSIERVRQLARSAMDRMRTLDLSNVRIQIFDGTVGWRAEAPFDRILVTAAAPGRPDALLDQLKPGGRMVVPEGDRHEQRLVSYSKGRSGRVARAVGDAVRFVPLLGRHGWAKGHWDES